MSLKNGPRSLLDYNNLIFTIYKKSYIKLKVTNLGFLTNDQGEYLLYGTHPTLSPIFLHFV